jgi:hypothetical protein
MLKAIELRKVSQSADTSTGQAVLEPISVAGRHVDPGTKINVDDSTSWATRPTVGAVDPALLRSAASEDQGQNTRRARSSTAAPRGHARR